MTQKALWLPVLRSHRAFLLQCSGKQSGQFFQPTDGLVQHLSAAGEVHADQVVHRLPEVLCAKGHGVLVRTLVGRTGQSVQQLLRRITESVNVPTRSLSCSISSSF